MRNKGLLLSIAAAGLLPALESYAARSDRAGLEHKPFAKAVYALGCRVHSFKWGMSRPKIVPFIALRYMGPSPRNDALRYKTSVFNFEFDMRKQPRFSTGSGWLDMGHQGRPHMFGADEYDRPRLAAVLYEDLFLTRVSFLPVFPERSDKLRVGHKWEMKVPPIVYSEEQTLKPPKEHAILRQEWLETVDLNGFVCAKISYQIEDGRADGAGAADGSFSMTGVVYFAIPEGVVVMDTAQIDASLMVEADLVRKRWLKNHLLMHYEPLEAKRPKEQDRKTWRYKYRPPPREEGHEATQRGRPRDGAPPPAEKAPRRWTREEYEAWLREAMRKREERKQKERKGQE